MDLSAFLTPPEILTAQCALCIQPHPDDNEIGMGGTIAALAARGCEIHYLTVTNGDLGAQGAPIEPAQLAALRRDEAVAAGKVDLKHLATHFFDFDDIQNAMDTSVRDKANVVKGVIKIAKD